MFAAITSLCLRPCNPVVTSHGRFVQIHVHTDLFHFIFKCSDRCPSILHQIKKTLKTLEIVELWWANERFSSQRQSTYQIALVCILGHIAQSPCHRSLSTSNTENWVVSLCADTEFTVVTGRGLGSINNVPKIKNAVTQYLNARGIIWRYLENNNGAVKFRVVHHKSLGQFDLKGFLFGLKGWVLSTKGAYHFMNSIWI